MNPAMMKKLQQMQKDIVKAQKELDESIFFGTAGGGAVTVEFTGGKEMVALKVDQEAFELSEDFEMMQDTILAAVNDCMKKIDDETANTMGQFQAGMGGLL